MWVDDRITREFINGDITSQAYKTYLRSQIDKQTPANTAPPPTHLTTDVGPLTEHQEKARIMFEAFKGSNFYASNWEKRFIEDQTRIPNPSPPQAERLERLWEYYHSNLR